MASVNPPFLCMLVLLLTVATLAKSWPTRDVDQSTYDTGNLLLFDPLRSLTKHLHSAIVGGGCTRGSKLSNSIALAMCQAAGIGIRSSSGRIGCRDPNCTSLEQVRCDTVLGIVAFQRACGCNGIVITGGTERGHASGTYSHYNGYKLDIAVSGCITGYVQANFRYSRTRGDGAKVYVDGRGNEYALEGNHWDIQYKY